MLVALYGDPLTAVFTERRADLRRHAGEISFPGGARTSPTRTCAYRAAGGRGGDRAAPRRVELQGALPPVGTS